MGLSIAIAGTSNSILKNGYSYGVAEHPGVSKLDNWSLGASTTVVLPKISNERTFELYDYVIFDFAVNEEQLLGIGATSVSDIKDRLVQFISRKLNFDSVVPVIALLPLDWGRDIPKPVSQFYKAFARERGYPFFDGYDYVAEIRHRIGRSYPLFQDAAHLLPTVAYGFGELIAETLVRSEKSPLLYTTREDIAAEYRYQKVSPSDHVVATPPLERKTSISSGTFYKVTASKKLLVCLDKEVRLCGLELNCAQTNANVVVDNGHNEVVRATNTRHYTGDGVKFIHAVVPVEPVTGKQFQLSAEPGQQANPQLEMAGFIFSGDQERITSPVWNIVDLSGPSNWSENIIVATINRIREQ